MSEDRALSSAEIPEFTGNLEQLEKDVTGISAAGTALWDAGSKMDTSFGGLSAFCKAPEAEQLFATTKSVATTGDELRDELETVASALSAYASEVRPLVQKFETLRAEAAAFERRIADDDEWREDGDLVEENNNRRSQVNAAFAAFQAAERTCHNKIVALVGGTPLRENDGSNARDMYGFSAEVLDHAEGLPGGDPVVESTPWYHIHEHLWDFGTGHRGGRACGARSAGSALWSVWTGGTRPGRRGSAWASS